MKDIGLLGLKVRDAVTGFEGVVTSISYDLYGCIQAIVSPAMDKDGKPGDSRWFDTKRPVILNQQPVMDVPDFRVDSKEAVPGPQEKSIPRNL